MLISDLLNGCLLHLQLEKMPGHLVVQYLQISASVGEHLPDRFPFKAPGNIIGSQETQHWKWECLIPLKANLRRHRKHVMAGNSAKANLWKSIQVNMDNPNSPHDTHFENKPMCKR